MFSPSQKNDKELLLEVALLIETLVKSQLTEIAEGWGDIYVKLDTKIKTYNYTSDDRLHSQYEKIFGQTA